jgi:hypothetical protein
VLQVLGEADARVDHQVPPVQACALRGFDLPPQLGRHVRHGVGGVVREPRHGLRRAPHVHEAVRDAQRGDGGEHGGVERAARHVVHQVGPGLHGGAGNCCVVLMFLMLNVCG